MSSRAPCPPSPSDGILREVTSFSKVGKRRGRCGHTRRPYPVSPVLCVRVRMCEQRVKYHTYGCVRPPPPSSTTARDHSWAPVLCGRPVQLQPRAVTRSRAAISRGFRKWHRDTCRLWRPCGPAARAFCTPSRGARSARARVVYPFTCRRVEPLWTCVHRFQGEPDAVCSPHIFIPHAAH